MDFNHRFFDFGGAACLARLTAAITTAALAGAACVSSRKDFIVAQKIPVTLEKHGDTRIDPYFWMRERDSAAVLEFLKSENERTEKEMASTKDR